MRKAADYNKCLYEHHDSNYRYPIIQEFAISSTKLLDHNGVARDVQRQLVKHINANLLSKFNANRVLGGMMPAPESVHTLISKGNSRKMCFEHHVCVMGCMLFPEDDPLLIACTFCNSPRYKNHSQVDAFVKNGGVLNATSASFFVPRQVIQIGSVASCLGELLVDEQKLQDLTYKHKFHDDPAYYRSDYYEDIFSGEVYQEFREKGVIQRNDIP